MWNEPTPEQLGRIPRLYATEKIPLEQKTIYEHFFLGGCDWYAAEYDPADRLCFGYAILNDDLLNSEWGYFSLNELRRLRIGPFEVDRDLFWKERPASEIERIVMGMRSH